MAAFSLKQGYCYLLIDDDWNGAPDDDWDNVVAPDYLFHGGPPPEYVGERVIDGAPCVVFRSPGGFWAQTTVMARN